MWGSKVHGVTRAWLECFACPAGRFRLEPAGLTESWCHECSLLEVDVGNMTFSCSGAQVEVPAGVMAQPAPGGSLLASRCPNSDACPGGSVQPDRSDSESQMI